MRTTSDVRRLYGVIGELSIQYHTDILGLLSIPIEALYFNFSMIRQGTRHEQS